MKIYSAHGISEFVICLGYKGYMVKEYFANYYLHTCDVTFDMTRNAMEVHQSVTEPWRVTLVDTGEATMTGGRLKRVLGFVGEEDFCLATEMPSPTSTSRRSCASTPPKAPWPP